METLHRQIALTLDRRQHEIAEAITERHFQVHPELEQRYGQAGRAKCRQDAHYHLAYLADSMLVNQPELFASYIGWAQVMLAERGIPSHDLRHNLEILADVVCGILSAEHAAGIHPFVQAAFARLAALPAPPAPELPQVPPFADLSLKYLETLLRGAACEAHVLIEEAVQAGIGVRDLYLHVFQASQREIGRRWQLNQISVAQEHFCTATTQFIMSQFYSQLFGTPRKDRRLVAACVGQELHEIGMRMVSDFFELDGWDTYYLGANVPVTAIVQAIELHQADVLALSATMTFHLRTVAQTIAAIRASSEARGVKIIIGGYPLNLEPAIWQSLGADGTAPDAERAVALANWLVERSNLTGGDDD